LKYGNDKVPLHCNFNVLMTSNCHLTLNLQGDRAAYERRICLLRCGRQTPKHIIPKFCEILVALEASGIANFALDGLKADMAREWMFPLTAKHRCYIEDLLCESESVNALYEIV